MTSPVLNYPSTIPQVEGPSTSFFSSLANGAAAYIKDTPIEAVAFMVASTVVRIFSHPLATPLLGIGIAMIATSLVLKTVSLYDRNIPINLTKEVCIFNKKHPKLQIIMTIFSFAISFLSKILGFASSILVGSFGSIILDVENYKLMQNASRNLQATGLGTV